MNLPVSSNLPVNLLAACFNNTSATYKYYWFLSILNMVERGNVKISKTELFAGMLSNAWFTVNYFHVSFGKQDLIQNAIREISSIENIAIDTDRAVVFNDLVESNNEVTNNHLWHFNNNVPHWFLSPWFPRFRRADIYRESKEFSQGCLYALYDEHIKLNPSWIEYLTTNSKVLKDFCYWNLSLFLQKKNPNIPDIPNKLIKPARRNSLTRQRTQFWDLVLMESGYLKCIYTGKNLSVGNYAVEHFIPYNFVSHDLIWNLIPSDISFNSSKSDKLPPLDKYFNSFYLMQKTAVEIINSRYPTNKFLEDYLTIFPDLDISFDEEKFRERIQPLVTIASNNGFEFLS